MALDIHILKNSNKETIISVSGSNDFADIALTSLASHDQVAGATGSQVVNVAQVMCTGQLTTSMSVRRGATGATGHLVFIGAPENAPAIQFNQYGFTEDGQNDKPIRVYHSGATGAAVTSWLVLHKQGGYNSKVEYEKYGAYDDETAVGALDIVGSPDYTG